MLLLQAALRLGSAWCWYAIDELHVTTWHLVALCWLHLFVLHRHAHAAHACSSSIAGCYVMRACISVPAACML
jgi:hypothetical protein